MNIRDTARLQEFDEILFTKHPLKEMSAVALVAMSICALIVTLFAAVSWWYRSGCAIWSLTSLLYAKQLKDLQGFQQLALSTERLERVNRQVVQQMSRLNQVLKEVQKQKAKLSSDLSFLQKENSSLKQANEELICIDQKIKEKAQNLGKTIEQLGQEKIALQEKIEAFEKGVSELSSQVAIHVKQGTDLRQQLGLFHEDVDQMQKEEQIRKASTQNMHQEIENLAQLIDRQQTLSQSTAHFLQRQILELSSSVQKLSQDIGKMQSLELQWKKESQDRDLSKSVQEIREQCQKETEALRQIRDQKKEEMEKIKQLQEQLPKLVQLLDEKLKAAQQNLDKSPQSHR